MLQFSSFAIRLRRSSGRAYIGRWVARECNLLGGFPAESDKERSFGPTAPGIAWSGPEELQLKAEIVCADSSLALTPMNESDNRRAMSELHIVVAASVVAAALILMVGSVLVWWEWQRGRRRLRERARPFVRAAPLAPQGTKRAEIERQTRMPEDRGGDPGESSTSFLRAELGHMRAENERLRSLVEPPQYSDDIHPKV